MSDQIIFKPRSSGSFNVSNFPGVQPVSDASADASLISIAGAITAAPAKLQMGVTGEGGKNYPAMVANRIYNNTFNTGATTLFTGAPGYYITGIFVSIDPKCTQSVASSVGCFFSDTSSGVLFSFYVFIPAASPTLTAAQAIIFQTPPGFFWNNKVSNSSMQFTLGTLTAGNFAVTVNYGLTSIVN